MSIDVLQERIRSFKNPSMVALCPAVNDLPMCIKEDVKRSCGSTLKAAAEAYRRFGIGILDALSDVVPAVSVVSGCYAALGAEGVAAMQDTLEYAAQKGYYVLLDLMREDLGSTAESIAAACFGKIQVGEMAYTPYPCDGVLMNGYLGTDSVAPFVGYCQFGKNVFIVARSSNRSAKEVQDLISGDRVIHQVMADLAMRWSTGLFSPGGYSQIGIAVGATNPYVLQTLREKYDRLFFLVPGFGAQGASAREASLAFDMLGRGACVIAGRSILNAHRQTGLSGETYRQDARDAAIRMRDELNAAIRMR